MFHKEPQQQDPHQTSTDSARDAFSAALSSVDTMFDEAPPPPRAPISWAAAVRSRPAPAPEVKVAAAAPPRGEPRRRCVIVLVGPPGCGKSTLCRAVATRLAARGAAPWARISQDDLGSRGACVAALRSALREGRSAIIDRCNHTPSQRAHWVDVARRDQRRSAGRAEQRCRFFARTGFCRNGDACRFVHSDREDGAAAAATAALAQLAVTEAALPPPFVAPLIVALRLDVPLETCVRRVMKRRDHPTLPPDAKSASIVRSFGDTLVPVATRAEGFDLSLSTGVGDHTAALNALFVALDR